MATEQPDDLLQDLRRVVATGDAIVFVGAGVSMGASGRSPAASWVGLLKDGARRCRSFVRPELSADWERRILEDIDSGSIIELLAAAEKISLYLKDGGGGEFRRWLRETVGVLPLQDTTVIEAIQALGLPIVTTNYDDLIERATGRRPVTWRETEEIEELLRHHEDGVIHLHGFFRDPESVVLGTQSYHAIRSSDFAQTLLRSIRLNNSIIYVGFGGGLEDPNIGAFLQWSRELFSGSTLRHFRLALNTDVATLQQNHPGEDRIYVIPYGDEHGDLAGFLRSIARPSRLSPSSAIGPAEASTSNVEPRLPGCTIRTTSPGVNSINELIDVYQTHFSMRWERRTSLGPNPVVYWPVRLRRPTPIHAMQCFAAVGLQRLGAKVVLCLDDFGDIDLSPEDFLIVVRRWVQRVGGNIEDLGAQRFTQLVGGRTMKDAWVHIQTWLGKSTYDLEKILKIAKLIPSDIETPYELGEVIGKRSKKLLTPAVVWTCLKKVRSQFAGRPFITLGGYDEKPLWEAWNECINQGNPVDHLYIPKLSKPIPGHSGDQTVRMENASLHWVSREDITNYLSVEASGANAAEWNRPERSIRWSLTGCVLLPDFVAGRFESVKVPEFAPDANPATIIPPLVEALDNWLLHPD